MTALGSLLPTAKRELADNPRLRAGVWAVIAILLIYWLLVQSDRKAAAYREYAASAASLRQAQAVLRRQDWPQLLAAAKETEGRLAAEFWQAATPGQAQAQVQAALTQLIADMGYRNPNIQAGATQPVPDAPRVLRVQVRLASTYQPGAELRLLEAIARHPKKLVVDSLDITKTNSRLVVLLSAYFVDVGEAASGGAGE